MELCLKWFRSRRRVLALLPALVFGLAQQGSAQNIAIATYDQLVAALANGFTTITNFNPTNSPTSPITISLTTAGAPTIEITTNVTIDAGTNSVVFLGKGTNAGTRFFNVHPNATLTLNNLELTNGGSTNGGAIFNAGKLIISNCVLTGNFATNASGVAGGNGPFNGEGNGTNGAPGGNASGGAIYSTGPVLIWFSILTNNTVQAGNGGNGGSATGETGDGGSAGYGGNAYGGALYSTGSSNVFYLTEFAGNSCTAGSGGSGGIFASNGPAGPSGSGGAAGLGGSCAGGAVFVTGSLYMSNCFLANNIAVGGSTGAAEVDSNGGGAEGSPGGSALGGGLFITNVLSTAWIQNSIFCFNSCHGGFGGSTALNAAIGGDGGQALGGGVWSGAGLVQMSFCTLATNFVVGGLGGTNTAAGVNGSAGATTGWEIFRSAGIFNLSSSILSYDLVGIGLPNAVGVTDGGYNICSDTSLLPRNTIIATTRLNANAFLDSAPTATAISVGGTFGSPIFTLALLTNSPAGGFVPGVPGATFPIADEGLVARTTPTSAGAFEVNPIFGSIPTNPVLPTIISTLPATNLTGAGGSVAFTNTVDTKDYSNPLPFGYQWQFNGTNIYDSANFFGTTTNVLVVRRITIANQGKYTVLVSPTLLEGATTSSVVELILTNPPTIQAQPVSQLGRPSGSIVTFTLKVLDPLNYNYQWMLDGTNLPDDSEYSGTNSNVLTIDPATEIDAGTYSVIVSNNYGFKKSANARLTIVPDRTRPTITITNPAANVRTNTPVFGGTVTDNAQVTNVMYWFTNINAGLNPVTNVLSGYATLTTSGNTNFNTGPNIMLWSITNAPWPGTNILAVQSVDYSSNVSTIAIRRFFYQVTNALTLTNVNNGGSGTLTGHAFIHGDAAPSNNAALNIGEGYSIVAAPNASSLLGNWTNISGTNVTVTNGNTLKFIMESNTVIQASFVSNIFLGAQVHGAYNGLFYVPTIINDNVVTNPVVGTNGMTNEVVSTNYIFTSQVTFESAGMLNNLVLGRQGTFSGRLLLTGGNYGLSGTFNAFGQATNTIARTAELGGTVIIDMTADTNGAGLITGSVSNAAWPNNAYLQADLATAAPGTSQYTLLMVPPTNAPTNMVIPPGDGYALIADHGGTVTLSGGLADGTTFSQTVPASQSNEVPVYASLYGRTGFLLGWLNLTNLDNTNADYELMWVKGTPAHPGLLFPDGFTNTLLAVGSAWTNPGTIALPSNTLVISNASLDLNYTVSVKNNNELYNPSGAPTNSLTGTINLQTGLLQITFGNGDGRATTRGYGAMLQNLAYAGGYFVTKTNAGSIILDGTNASEQPFSFPQTPEQQAADMIIHNALGGGSGPPLPLPLALPTNGLDGSTNFPPPPPVP